MLIARQEAVVREFDSHGAAELALTARELLERFREILAFARERLSCLERQG